MELTRANKYETSSSVLQYGQKQLIPIASADVYLPKSTRNAAFQGAQCNPAGECEHAAYNDLNRPDRAALYHVIQHVFDRIGQDGQANGTDKRAWNNTRKGDMIKIGRIQRGSESIQQEIVRSLKIETLFDFCVGAHSYMKHTDCKRKRVTPVDDGAHLQDTASPSRLDKIGSANHKSAFTYITY